MSLFDFFHNSLLQQEWKQNRRQNERQMTCDDLEAEVYMDFDDEMENERQNGIWQNDYDTDSQDDGDYMNEYDSVDMY